MLLDAFMPAKDHETSTHRLQGVRRWRAKALGHLVVAGYHGGRLHGRVCIVAGDVIGTNGLWLKADKLSLHVGIRGWPPPKPKARQKALAGLLAEKAHLELY